MVKPWMGVTPPPRGQGYYANEEGFNAGFYPPHTDSVQNAIDLLKALGYTVSKNNEENA